MSGLKLGDTVQIRLPRTSITREPPSLDPNRDYVPEPVVTVTLRTSELLDAARTEDWPTVLRIARAESPSAHVIVSPNPLAPVIKAFVES